jgi:hypothetical protein
VVDTVLSERRFTLSSLRVSSYEQRVSETIYTPCYLINTRNHWVSGHCPTSGIINTGKHNVSETGFVSALR